MSKKLTQIQIHIQIQTQVHKMRISADVQKELMCKISSFTDLHMNKSSALAETGDHLATTDISQKEVGAAVPHLWGRELGSHLTQCGPG